jgi:FkbM family methyltransferase
MNDDLFLNLTQTLDQVSTRVVDIFWSVKPNILQMDPCDVFLPQSFFDFFVGDIRADYVNLIKGLDEDSLLTVGRIISRIQKHRKEGSRHFWFSEFEREELKKIYDLHSASIFQLSNDCFAYNKYLLPCNIISTTVFYYRHFVDLLEDKKTLKGKHIVDVGGFIGDSALILSEYTEKQVHVFEPISNLNAMAKKTIEMNGLSNVILNQIALGEKPGKVRMKISGDTSCIKINENLVEQELDEKHEDVFLTTLDDYVRQNNLEVGLIKVDVEGFEQPFLRGAIETIKTQRPAMLLSIYHNPSDFFHIKPLIDSLGLGYQFKIRKPSDLNVLIDTCLICEVPNLC